MEHIGIFPTISFTIFFLFFLGLLVYVVTTKKEHVAHMSAMPLEDNAPLNNTTSKHQQ